MKWFSFGCWFVFVDAILLSLNAPARLMRKPPFSIPAVQGQGFGRKFLLLELQCWKFPPKPVAWPWRQPTEWDLVYALIWRESKLRSWKVEKLKSGRVWRTELRIFGVGGVSLIKAQTADRKRRCGVWVLGWCFLLWWRNRWPKPWRAPERKICLRLDLAGSELRSWLSCGE